VLKKPFQNLARIHKPLLEEKVGVPPDGYKNSTLSLTTSSKEARAKIVKQIKIRNNLRKLNKKKELNKLVKEFALLFKLLMFCGLDRRDK